MNFKNVGNGIILGGLLTFASIGVAHADTYVQNSNALHQYTAASLRTVNDSQVKFVKANGDYSFSSNPSGSTTINSVSGTKWALKTKYLLPNTRLALGKANYDMTNPQSAATNGKYLFVVYAPHQLNGKGFIVRYDRSKLASMGFEKSQNAPLAKNSAAIKVGPLFQVGHGQSLAYDKKHHSLWMWRDSANMTATRWSTIQNISTTSLKPKKAIKFYMNNHGANVPSGHDLTFDTTGHAYWWTTSSGQVKIYRGVISGNHISVTLTKQLLTHQPGTHQQSIGYNSRNGRLYLVSDDSIVSLPARQLNGRGSLTHNSFKYTKFNSGREFESLFYDGSGHGMLLSNRNPEILASTTMY
ncbi:hypothetical protein [Lentilactobacillus sp. SPB1-3]|uniref:Uncharacterized protein n=1 Tax=Lentilactobacillus terminaliae TaxID=3003483 RepID=A0ACD5DGZ1_9LACO|nr:hypothetical protein [Lentilactobacillus sp. SPB1-3]MCZ0977005.1 hypothetical protein [Lentilactobacillus sp. SPB1-3]